jgi:hypothetical protein
VEAVCMRVEEKGSGESVDEGGGGGFGGSANESGEGGKWRQGV